MICLALWWCIEVDPVAKNSLPSYELADFLTIEQWIEAGRGGSQFDRFDKVAYLIALRASHAPARARATIG